MKLYRPKISIYSEGCPTKNYYAPFVTLRADYGSIEFKNFVDEAILLYIQEYSDTTVEHHSTPHIELDMLKLEFHPLKDIIYYFKHLF